MDLHHQHFPIEQWATAIPHSTCESKLGKFWKKPFANQIKCLMRTQEKAKLPRTNVKHCGSFND
ncbi:hypothetical protein M5D96_003952 [Drosophila gunungcola]|uniref:Uncharacterized protein n=1 Tax=Drosophila gunungcola TaxID=103775 RepID=A0A9Q0BSK5_9MUSC|nr:hypothetical protein M5D96_003952 [Drosophila gunungcola]